MRGIIVSIATGVLAGELASMWADHIHITFEQGFPIMIIGIIAGAFVWAIN